MPIPPNEPADADWLLLSRYCGGECTPAEQRRVADWIAGDGERKAWVESLQVTWHAARSIPTPAQALSSLRRAKVHLGLPADPGVTPQTLPVPSSRGSGATLYRWPQGVGGGIWRRGRTNPAVGGGDIHAAPRAARPQSVIAAMVVIALGVGLAIRSVSRHPEPTSPRREYATAAGQRLSVTLVDGTRVTLAPASRVQVAAAYAASTREVQVEGEAYFIVTHDVAHPFVVLTHGAVARDVGTAFDVRAYPEDAGARVTVAEGSVVVALRGRARAGPASDHTTNGPALTPGDLAIVSDSAIVVTHHANIAALTAWMQGRLVFEATPLSEVARQVGRAFDLDVRVADSTLARQPVTAAFTDQEVDVILDEVTDVLGAQFTRTGRMVVIRRRPVGAQRPGTDVSLPLRTALSQVPHE